MPNSRNVMLNSRAYVLAIIRVLIVLFIFAVAADRFLFDGRYATATTQTVRNALIFR